MVHQIEARGVGVGLLYEVVARMIILPFTAFLGALVEVHGQRSNSFRKNPHTCPDRREIERPLFGDVRLSRSIGDHISRDHFVDRRFELRRGHAPFIPALYKRKPLHSICFAANISLETNMQMRL